MIIDAHAHAWSAWPFDPPVPDPASRGTADQLLHEMDLHGVDEALVVSARVRGNPANNEYVAAEVVRHRDRLHQLVDVDSTWTDTYHAPGAEGRLRELADRLRPAGFTHYLRDEPDAWLTSDDGMRMFEVAAERGLLASLATTPAWQPEIRKVARAFPTLPILLHHLGGIVAAEGPRSPGLTAVLESASCPNILVKVSGFYYGSRTEWDFPFADAIEVVRALYEQYGARRLAWGSDYPVVTRAMTYRQAMEVVRSHCPFIDEADQGWLMGGTVSHLLEHGLRREEPSPVSRPAP